MKNINNAFCYIRYGVFLVAFLYGFGGATMNISALSLVVININSKKEVLL
jgi:hypothetical protein